ncbi:hypothetical protein BpHYR1_006119 [Brachionus plicatilis]|uniref:Uncharacterized protein n=1 Tax=Brachionus plicatilis TaxID=10195 RepID=A0A3M7QGM5_BRAPC|nr:hypothetical protein BpHYR1_006119 [Brachionus plicatilis]
MQRKIANYYFLPVELVHVAAKTTWDRIKIQCIKDVNKGDKRGPAGWIQNGSYPSFQSNDTIINELIIIIIQVENLKKFVFEKYFEIHLMYLQNVKINHILLEPYRDGSQNDLI